MKNTVILTGIAGALGWMLFKVNNLINAGKRITIETVKVHNLYWDIQSKQIQLMLNVVLANPSTETFPIRAKYVDLYDLEQKHLASANPPQAEFKLLPGSTHQITDVAVMIPIPNINDIIFHALRTQLNVLVVLEVHGIEVKLNQLITYTNN